MLVLGIAGLLVLNLSQTTRPFRIKWEHCAEIIRARGAPTDRILVQYRAGSNELDYYLEEDGFPLARREKERECARMAQTWLRSGERGVAGDARCGAGIC